MSLKLDCQKLDHDEDSARCSVCGWIYDCPTECSEYVNFFGKQPYKNNTEIENLLKGGDT